MYQRLGDVPRKRHIQFRDNGTLLNEEVFGLEGFSGNESILYHLQSPCPDPRARRRSSRSSATSGCPRHTRTGTCAPTTTTPEGGDAISARRLLMWNEDVEISIARPTEEMEFFYRNGEGDEVIFVHEGPGTLETIFGDLPYREGDYVVIPRGTTYRFANGGPQRHLVFESPGLIEIPRRYRNEYGQLLEHAPFYHRDIHPPTELQTHRDRGEHRVKVRVRDGYQTYVLDYHPFDVVGWDGYVYPWTFNIEDFEPITGPHPHAAAVAPDLPGPELRDLLVLPAQARLRPAGDPDPVRPLERELGGDDLLRLRATSPRGRRSTSGRSRCTRRASRTGRIRAWRRSRSG